MPFWESLDKDTASILLSSFAVAITIISNFILFGLRRSNDREYNERFNLYKVLVIDRTPNLIKRFTEDYKGYSDKIPQYRQWKLFGMEDKQTVFSEVDESKNTVYQEFILPLRFYSKELSKEVNDRIEIMYDNIAEMFDDEEFMKSYANKWSEDIDELLKVLESSSPRHSVGTIRKLLRLGRKKLNQYRYWIDGLHSS